MAYNNGFPVTYPQMNYGNTTPYNLQPQTYGTPVRNNPQWEQPNLMTPNDTGIIWVQGEAGAKSYPVAPGKSVMLMDSESLTFYIKSADANGMPLPLKVYDYTERVPVQQTVPPVNDFVTREELEQRLSELMEAKKPATKKEGK